MYCNKCGTKIKDGNNTCANCGNELKESYNYNNSGEKTVYIPNYQNDGYAEGANPVKKAGPPTKEYKSSAGQKILSVLMCVFIFVFAAADITVMIFRKNINKESIGEIIRDFDIMSVQVDSVITETLPESAGIDLNDEDSLAIWIYNNLNAEDRERYNITVSNIKAIYRKSNIKDFIQDKLNNYIDYYMNGVAFEPVSSKDIIRLVKRNASVIRKETGYELDDLDYKNIETMLEESEVLENFTVSAIDRSAGVSVSRFKFAVSIYAVIILTVVQLLLLAVILFINKMRMRSVCIYGGITYLVCGLIFAVGGAITYFSVDALLRNIKANLGNFPVEKIVDSICGSLVSAGLITAGAGVLLIIIYYILKKLTVYKTKKT